MPDDDKPVVDTLTLPVASQQLDVVQHAYWLRLADIALARAREEQQRIKERIQPHVERFQRIERKRRRKIA
jgi:hypothetical protein